MPYSPDTDPFEAVMNFACDQAALLMLTVTADAVVPARLSPAEQHYCGAAGLAPLSRAQRRQLRKLGPRVGAEYRRALLLRDEHDFDVRDEIEPGRIATLIESVCQDELAALAARQARQADWRGTRPDLISAEDFAFGLHHAFAVACPDPAAHRPMIVACAVGLARELRDLLQVCAERLEALLSQESQVVHVDGEEADRMLMQFAETEPMSVQEGGQKAGPAAPQMG